MHSISKSKVLTLTLGVLVLGTIFTSTVNAQCGAALAPRAAAVKASIKPAAFLLGGAAGQFGRDRDRDDDQLETIVGLWKVQFVAKNSPGIPDGVVVDHGYSAWHSDFTEFLNSARSPLTGSFCLGVWKKVGYNTFKLNHYAMAFDPTGTTPVGTVNIREEVTVDWAHNKFNGTFTIDAYDPNGVHYPANQPGNHAQGVITGERITVNTLPEDH